MIVTGAPTIIRESWGSVKTFEYGHFFYLFISPPPHVFMLSHLREGSCSSSRLPALRGSLPHARLPQLENPFRGPGDTGN